MKDNPEKTTEAMKLIKEEEILRVLKDTDLGREEKAFLVALIFCPNGEGLTALELESIIYTREYALQLRKVLCAWEQAEIRISNDSESIEIKFPTKPGIEFVWALTEMQKACLEADQ